MSDSSSHEVPPPAPEAPPPPPAIPPPPPPEAAPGPSEPAGRWRDRRVPWVLAGAAALLACLLGAGAATVGAVVIGHSDRGGDRPNQMDNRDAQRFPGDPRNGDQRNRDQRNGDGGHRNGAPGRPAPQNPAPSASAVPSPS